VSALYMAAIKRGRRPLTIGGLDDNYLTTPLPEYWWDSFGPSVARLGCCNCWRTDVLQ